MDENKTNSEPDDSAQLPPTQHDELKADHHQPIQPFAPVAGPNQAETPEQPAKKSSKWRSFFKYSLIITTVLQAAGVTLFFLAMIWLGQQAEAGASGTEFFAIILFMSLVPAVGIVALVTLIGLPLYLIKYRVRGMWLAFGIISILISFVLVGYGAYTVYVFRVAIPQQSAERDREFGLEQEEYDRQFAADNANPEISKEEAIELLQNCELRGFYYTKETREEHGTSPATSATGIVLTKIDGDPYRISIAFRLVPELLPVAREAQQNCDGWPQIIDY